MSDLHPKGTIAIAEGEHGEGDNEHRGRRQSDVTMQVEAAPSEGPVLPWVSQLGKSSSRETETHEEAAQEEEGLDCKTRLHYQLE